MTTHKKKKIKLGVSGDQGSFSEEAGLLYANREGLNAEIVYSIDMEGVLSSLDQEKTDLGIFPVVNSRGGLVQTAFEAMGCHLFRLVDEVWIEIQQCLLAYDGVEKKDVIQIATHPQAISQCERYIKREFPDAKLIDWEDTAKAARDLASGTLPRATAVIAPARAAHLYGLTVLEKSIQDQHPNLTTFIVVSK
ncbi:chorismate mutase [Candidatus Uhrbacteria bacterium]|nr:chorismate mutase [Candidatus Uhrbacteria bacterium]